MQLSDRIFKNWKTSVLGALILGGSLAAVFTGKASLTEAGAFIAMGCTLFFLKDNSSSKPNEPKE
jgi:hypothetical protein